MPAIRVQAERVLLQEILLRLRASAWPVIALATPNGLHIPARDAREGAIKARMINRMRADGMTVAGAPDLALLWAGGCGFAELKRPAFKDIFGYHPAGHPSEDQKNFAARCHKIGIPHAYVRSWDQFESTLREWGAI